MAGSEVEPDIVNLGLDAQQQLLVDRHSVLLEAGLGRLAPLPFLRPVYYFQLAGVHLGQGVLLPDSHSHLQVLVLG